MSSINIKEYYNYHRNRIKMIIIMLMLCLCFGTVSFCYINNETKSKTIKIDNNDIVNNEISNIENKIYVDIKGEVIKEGVYDIEYGSRVYDQTTPNMIQELKRLLIRNPLISIEI